MSKEFITSLFEGRTCNDKERQLLSPPAKLGGMGITDIASISDTENKLQKRQRKSWWIKSKIKKTETVLTLKTAAANKKNLTLQLNFMTTFSETFEAK